MLISLFSLVAVFGFILMILSVVKEDTLIFPLLAAVCFMACTVLCFGLDTQNIAAIENTVTGEVVWYENTVAYDNGWLLSPFFLMLAFVMLLLAIYEWFRAARRAVKEGPGAVTGIEQ